MYDVFISYSRKDSRLAERVCKALSQASLSYFIDREGISAGVSFTEVVSKAIDASRIFLFLASSNAYKSKFTTAEVFYAFKHKPNGAIIPYLLDEEKMPSELEFLLSTTNWLEMQNDPIETSLIPAICKALEIINRPTAVTKRNKIPAKIIVAIAAAILVVGGGFALTRFINAKRNAQIENDRVDAALMINRSDSLLNHVAWLQRQINPILTTDQQIDCLKKALTEATSAQELKDRYQGGRFESQFAYDAEKRISSSQAKLDSMQKVWAGYAKESYELYQITELDTEAQNVLDCIEHALRIQPDVELETIKKALGR